MKDFSESDHTFIDALLKQYPYDHQKIFFMLLWDHEISLIQCAIQKGLIDQSYRDPESQKSFLQLMFMSGHCELFNFWIKNGLKWKIDSFDDSCPLMLAIEHGQREIVKNALKKQSPWIVHSPYSFTVILQETLKKSLLHDQDEIFLLILDQLLFLESQHFEFLVDFPQFVMQSIELKSVRILKALMNHYFFSEIFIDQSSLFLTHSLEKGHVQCAEIILSHPRIQIIDQHLRLSLSLSCFALFEKSLRHPSFSDGEISLNTIRILFEFFENTVEFAQEFLEFLLTQPICTQCQWLFILEFYSKYDPQVQKYQFFIENLKSRMAFHFSQNPHHFINTALNNAQVDDIRREITSLCLLLQRLRAQKLIDRSSIFSQLSEKLSPQEQNHLGMTLKEILPLRFFHSKQIHYFCDAIPNLTSESTVTTGPVLFRAPSSIQLPPRSSFKKSHIP